MPRHGDFRERSFGWSFGTNCDVFLAVPKERPRLAVEERPEFREFRESCCGRISERISRPLQPRPPPRRASGPPWPLGTFAHFATAPQSKTHILVVRGTDPGGVS